MKRTPTTFTALVAPFTLGAFVALGACSSDDDKKNATPSTTTGDGGASNVDGGTSSTTDATATSPTGCKRTAKTGDYARHVVISHPFDTNGAKAKSYEALTLDTSGKLARASTRFDMANNFDAPIVFSPDGEVGVSVQDNDGTLGIFRFEAGAAAPKVVDAGFGKDLFYADAVVFSADGSHVYVADFNRETTGGLHRIAIACDGTPTYEGHIVAMPSAAVLSIVPGTDKLIVAAGGAPGAPAKHDVFRFDVAGEPKLESSIALFGDAQLTAAGMGLTSDGKVGLVADGNDVLGTKRVGVFTNDGALAKLTVVEDIEAPSGVAISPYGNAAIVTAAGGGSVDAIHLFEITGAGASANVTAKGKMTFSGAKPQLPASPVVIGSGALKGHVLVGEVEGIRQLRFEANGTVTDLGLFAIDGGLEESVGAVGVEP